MYQQLGGWSAIPALAIAWFAHLTVSVLYGLMSGIIAISVLRLPLVVLFATAFSWATTVIAPPANAIIVQLVSFQHVDGNNLPALNFNLDEKYVLHLAFFAAITGVLYVCKTSRPKLSQHLRMSEAYLRIFRAAVARTHPILQGAEHARHPR